MRPQRVRLLQQLAATLGFLLNKPIALVFILLAIAIVTYNLWRFK